jgi:hypothetical protein
MTAAASLSGIAQDLEQFTVCIPDLHCSHRRSLRARLSSIPGGQPMFGRASLED